MGPDKGDALLRGERLGSLDAATVSRGIGSVPQDDIIHTALPLRRALEYSARLRLPAGTSEEAIAAAVDRVLRDIELTDRATVRIRRLSGGQRKRASMALELLLAPPALLLDEPTSGLDPDLEASTMRLLRRLADEGRGVLTTTHATASLAMADLVVLVVKGYLAWAGPIADALRHFGVPDPDLIFKTLRGASPAEWAARYRQSPMAQRMSARPAPVRGRPPGRGVSGAA